MKDDGPRTADAEAVTRPEGGCDRAGPSSTPPASDSVASAVRVASKIGRYQLVLPLAQGGMGVVFAARLVGSHGVERLVAIKTLRPITSKNDRTALLREAKLTARLHHRNVVATIDLGELDDVPYVVMELIDGVPFSRLLAELETSGEKLAPSSPHGS